MARIVLIDNFDSFTFNLVDYFRRFGHRVAVFRNTTEVATVSRQRPDLMVYSPGPGVPATSGNLLSYINHFRGRVPQFGVCLGLQAFVVAGGGTLRNLAAPVHGKQSEIVHDGKTIFVGLPNPFATGRYHSWVARRLPEDFTVSATLSDKRTVMGLRSQDGSMEAVQFHPESILTMREHVGERLIENVCNLYL